MRGRMNSLKKLSNSLFPEDYWRLFEEISGGVVVSDKTTKVLYANAAAIRMLGFSRKAFYRMKLYNLVHPADRRWVKEYAKDLKKKKHLVSERKLRRSDGRYVTIER